MTLTFSNDALALRPMTLEDADTLLVWRNHPSVRQMMYTTHVITSEEHRKWLDKTLSDASCAFFIFEISGEPTGVVGFSGMDSQYGRAQWTFHLRPDIRVSGAGAAMGLLALQHAFDVIGVRKLEGEVLAGNEKSLRFHQRLGFREEGLRRAHVCHDGEWKDVYEFSMLRGEWGVLRTRLFEELPAKMRSSEASRAKPRLLITGGGGATSQSLQAQWGARYDLWFADANPHAFPPSIPEDRRLVIPFASDPGFADRLQKLCQEHGIDLIIPGVDEELLILAEKKGRLGWPRILVPDSSFVALMLDKLACARAIAEAGLDAPKTLPLDQAAEIGFPLIAKPRSGRGSRGVMRLSSAEQAAAYLTLHGGPADDYIAQELIDGAEFTVFVAADGGEAPCAVIAVRAFEKRGVTVRAQTESNSAIVSYARAFQAHFRASGCYNIQCMLTQEGCVFPFEVNPRVSTTFVLAVATGFDPVPMALGESTCSFVPERHLTLHRSWHTHIAPKDTEAPKDVGATQ